MMEIFIWWLFLSFVAAVIASRKGRSAGGFFLLSMILSPLIGIIAAAIAAPNVEHLEAEKLESGDVRKCPDCAELVRAEAVKCRYCGAALVSTAPDQPTGSAGYDVGKAIGSAFKSGRESGKQPKA